RFSYFSQRLKKFGADESLLIGRRRTELADDIDGQPEKWRDHLAALDRHEPFRDFVYRARSAARGTRYVSISGKPVFDAAGGFVGYRGSARDVTAMIEAEERLRASEARQRDFAETASDWYWETDADYRFSYISEASRKFGLDNRLAMGKTRMEIASDRKDHPEKWREHEAIIARREPFRDFVYKMRVP